MWQWKRRVVAGAAALAVAAVAVVTWSDNPVVDPNAPRDPTEFITSTIPPVWFPGELFGISLTAKWPAEPPIGLTILGHLPGGGTTILETDEMNVPQYSTCFPTVGWQHLTVSVHAETYDVPKDIHDSIPSLFRPAP